MTHADIISNHSAASAQPMLSLRGISVHFGGVQAVSDLSFDVIAGKVTALIGTNGAGKTTVFNVIAGAIDPNQGSVNFGGEDVTGLLPPALVAKGLVHTFQQIRLFPQLSVLDNLLLGLQRVPGEDLFSPLLRWRSVAAAERNNVLRVMEFMRSWGMLSLANQVAADLSYGEQKLVAIGRALMSNPRMLLLDEPLAGLTAKAVEDMLQTLRQLVDSGCTLLIVEHNIGAVMRLAEHIVVMHLGSKIAEGSSEEIAANARVREVYLGG